MHGDEHLGRVPPQQRSRLANRGQSATFNMSRMGQIGIADNRQVLRHADAVADSTLRGFRTPEDR